MIVHIAVITLVVELTLTQCMEELNEHEQQVETSPEHHISLKTQQMVCFSDVMFLTFWVHLSC